MHTKLKLKIELFTDSVATISKTEVLSYIVRITVLEKDERFQPNETTGEYIRFRGDNLYVKCIKNKKFGGLFQEGIMLPHNDVMGYGFIKTFDTDKERYLYLKMLYTTLYDWCTYWWGFESDTNNKINITDDGWDVVCTKTEEEFYVYPF